MRKRTAFVLLGLLSMAQIAPAADPSARDIMEKNFFSTKLDNFQAESSMVLINDQGETRQRRSANLSKIQGNGVDSKVVVRFSSPEDIKGTAFLQIEHSDGDDDLWIYLPALKKSRRLVSNNKRDSFVGSDFSYGDILLPKVDLWRHTLLRSEAVSGQDCYVIQSVPANDAVRESSGYSKRISWVRKDNFVEAKVQYFDVSGQLFKTQLVSGYQLIDPKKQRWVALRREMSNVQSGHKTVLTFDHVASGVSLSDDAFTTRTIERE